MLTDNVDINQNWFSLKSSSMTLGIMNDMSDQGELIQLEPLLHQVGGHSSMFVLDDVTVCKPLIGREYQFYRTLPPEMKKYIPEFRGSLQVLLQEDRNGLYMAALPNEQTVSLRNTQGPFKNGRRLRQVSTSSFDYDSSSSDDELLTNPCNSSTSPPVYPSAMHLTEGEPKNPWLDECQQSHLNRLKLKSDSSNVIECIMLENLTFKFRYPCVLDLKMGTRQYGDDAPDSKRRSQTNKAANTTTVSLGVRLAGMQVYNREKKCFTCKNKYYGRQLTEDGFKQTLRQFLHNGRRLQLDIMDAITTKLKELRSIISKLESFRFFTSSLLILYDSFEPLKFSQSGPKSYDLDIHPDSENFLPPDINKGSVGAVRKSSKESPSTAEMLTPRDRESWLDHSQSSVNINNASSVVVVKSLRDHETQSFSKSKVKPSKQRRPQKPRVDIRLIDFAHATHKGMGDSIFYKGPDEGILLGLDSIIRIFQDIRDGVER